MFLIFLSIFLIFVAVWLFFSLSVLYHLRKYSMPGWTAARFVAPCFFTVSVLFFLAAIFFLTTIQYDVLSTLTL